MAGLRARCRSGKLLLPDRIAQLSLELRMPWSDKQCLIHDRPHYYACSLLQNKSCACLPACLNA